MGAVGDKPSDTEVVCVKGVPSHEVGGRNREDNVGVKYGWFVGGRSV